MTGGYEAMRIPYRLFRFAFTAALGGLGLFGFANALQRQVSRGSRSEGPVTRMVNVKTELRSVFAPRALFDFAKAHPEIERHDQLASLLEAEGLGGSWYVILATDVLSNGECYRNMCYVYPSRMPYRFASSKVVLAMLRGDFPPDRQVRGEKPKIVILPDELTKLDPEAVAPDLMEMAR